MSRSHRLTDPVRRLSARNWRFSDRCLLPLLFLTTAVLGGGSAAAQGEAVPSRISQAIESGDEEGALKELDRLLGKAPQDRALLRIKMTLLIRMRDVRAALECAEELSEVLPEGVEKQAVGATARRLQGVVDRSELQDLEEKARLYRRTREPARYLRVVLRVQDREPTDPATYLAMGEVYASRGPDFNRRKAEAAFERFLDLTSDATLAEAVRMSKKSREDLHREARWGIVLGQRVTRLPDIRMMVQEHLKRLKDNDPLLLLTPQRVIDGMLKDRQDRIERWRAVVSECHTEIRECERGISRFRSSRHDYRGSNIGTLNGLIKKLERKIAKANKSIAEDTAEIQRIRREIGQSR